LEKSEIKYTKTVDQWYSEHGETDVGKEIKFLKEQIEKLESIKD